MTYPLSQSGIACPVARLPFSSPSPFCVFSTSQPSSKASLYLVPNLLLPFRVSRAPSYPFPPPSSSFSRQRTGSSRKKTLRYGVSLSTVPKTLNRPFFRAEPQCFWRFALSTSSSLSFKMTRTIKKKKKKIPMNLVTNFGLGLCSHQDVYCRRENHRQPGFDQHQRSSQRHCS